jgi:radical S-adenosyl methionine domain-containing protein 2
MTFARGLLNKVDHMVNNLSNPLVSVSELVINWHITEACNYSCNYCYAKWSKSTHARELINNEYQTRELIKELFRFFTPNNENNSLSRIMQWDSIRINFAGGEPTLYKDKLLNALSFAKSIGFNVSLITNGSNLLGEDFLKSMVKYLSILGISLDSTNRLTNEAIGRMDRNRQATDVDSILYALKIAKENNPEVLVKINTVVNKLNYYEDMSEIINLINPDKWKVLRILPVIANNLDITDSQFNDFINRHEKLKYLIRAEDNKDMTESYIMIDPVGRFFQNSKDKMGYLYSGKILEIGVSAALNEIAFDFEKFSNRY